MLSISDVLLAGRGVITGPGVIFAVVVVCQQKQQQQLQQQRQLQQQEWRPWGKRCVENNYGSKEPQSVCGDHPRDVIPGLAGVIVLET